MALDTMHRADASMASASDRLRDLKAFDDTKAGVKGLVDAGLTTVPAIFRHPPETFALDASHKDRFSIPVIDLAGVTSHRAELVAEVKAAAETAGFFQVVKHGVPGEVMSEMLAAVRSFNEQPAEARRPYYSRDLGSRMRYHSNFDLFRSAAANWRDTLYLDMAAAPPPPEEIMPACRGVAAEFTREVLRLGGTLFELLSEALGLHRGHLGKEAGCLEGLTVVGHYYPASPQPELTMGTSRHSDPGFLTVVLQDGVGGLQVLDGGGDGQRPAWVDVPAEPGALVVNVGDFLQLLTNDRLKSVEHRVVSNSVGPRVSVACFFRTNGAAAAACVCGPIKELLGASPPRYRSATMEELIVHYRENFVDGASMLDNFRI